MTYLASEMRILRNSPPRSFAGSSVGSFGSSPCGGGSNEEEFTPLSIMVLVCKFDDRKELGWSKTDCKLWADKLNEEAPQNIKSRIGRVEVRALHNCQFKIEVPKACFPDTLGILKEVVAQQGPPLAE